MASTTGGAIAAMVQTYDTVSCWRQFEDIYEKHFRRKRGRFYYRGQSDASWELSTTHERLLYPISPYIPSNPPYPSYAPGKVASSSGSRMELLALRAFQARSTKFVSNPSSLEDTLEWLAPGDRCLECQRGKVYLQKERNAGKIRGARGLHHRCGWQEAASLTSPKLFAFF